MTGIGIPPIGPVTGGDGSIWSGIVSAIVLLMVLCAAIWTYIRSRPTNVEQDRVQTELPKAA